jgi:hypothetical protein
MRRSVLLVEKTEVRGETGILIKLSLKDVSNTPDNVMGINLIHFSDDRH